MSHVFVAHDRTLGREVVVKVLPDMAADVSAERFTREIQLAARLQHPHIVPLLSAGDAAGLPYFVMPYIAGESLRDRLRRAGELPVPEAVRILRDIATAIDYAHRQGIVHRDIKPENVLITDGTAVVTDFGVAKALAAATGGGDPHTLTSVGMTLGTPAYMAPEQAAADPTTDHRADIYAWGIVAYEVLSGSTPFAGRPAQAQFAAHMAEAPTPLQRCREGVPERLCELVMRSLAKRPADRPQSAAELVRELDELTATGVHEPLRRGRQRFRARNVAIAAVALLVAAAATVAVVIRRDAGTAAPEVVKSIAVLPFANAGGSDDYFVEGMSDELSAALGKIPGIQVASRTSTFAFKGQTVDLSDVGKKLGVDAVLEGRVRRANGRLRVTAQLSDAKTGLSLWSDAFEREVKDVFAVQDDIARAIAGALQLRLQPTVAAATSAEARGTHDLVAYDYYLRGRYSWHRRGAEELRTAISFFERAIERDPNFARAHAGLALAAVLLPEYSDVADASALERRADAAVNRALSLDSTIAEAYAARGLARVHDWDWRGAEQAYRNAIRLDPRYATGHQWYGELLYHLGRADESVAAMRRSAELDPLAPIAAVALAYALTTARRYDEALREAKRALELDPNLGIIHRVLSIAYLFTGDSAKAYEHAETATRLEPEIMLRFGQLVYVAGKAGMRPQAERAAAQIRSKARGQRVGPFVSMWVHLGFGEFDRAAAAFEQAVAEHDLRLSGYSMLADPAFDPLRNLPTFQRGLARMGLASPSRR